MSAVDRRRRGGRVVVASALMLAACGGATGGDDAPVIDGGGGGALDPADCAGVASGLVAAATACGTPVPGGAQAQIESRCRRGLAKADACGADPAGGLACFRSPDATDWVCIGGEPFPSCDGDLGAALGMYCVLALGNPECASGVACTFDADCGGLECNGATGECFSKDAYCVGLPCTFDADCPTGEACNSAEGACVAE
jgi:hypothetical protein